VSETRVAIITGAARGIGAAVADRLTADGWRVIGIDRDWDAHPPVARALTTDLSHRAAIDRLITQLRTEAPIRALIHNAGLSRRGALEELTDDDIDLVLQTDLLAVMQLTRGLLGHLADEASVTLVSSVRASRAVAGDSAYIAAKGGVEALTRALAVELGPRGIRANAVAPGIVGTSMNRPALADDAYRNTLTGAVPLRRLGAPGDVADVIAFLAGDGARYVSGVVIPVDGGWSAAI
jgi:NAD(P)-dependent dehydrogenase (short-subunit alcohol dehydrogenase family)